MKILQHCEHRTDTIRDHYFHYADNPGWGFGFACDEQGNVDTSKINPAALDNYTQCLTGEVRGLKVIDAGIRVYHNHYTLPAIGECVYCRAEVELSGFTNTCECGADYNSTGQVLADRAQWGEETGESLGDILRIR